MYHKVVAMTVQATGIVNALFIHKFKPTERVWVNVRERERERD